jgi:hypothetical protein
VKLSVTLSSASAIAPPWLALRACFGGLCEYV